MRIGTMCFDEFAGTLQAACCSAVSGTPPQVATVHARSVQFWAVPD